MQSKYVSLRPTLALLTAATAATIAACGDDENPNGAAPTGLQASSFSAQVLETSAIGAALGQISASTSTGTLSFALVNQAPEGALALDTTTGALTVADAAAFDFEENTSITATVDVSNGSSTKQVAVTMTVLNDLREDADGAVAYYPFTGNTNNALADQYNGTTSATLANDRDGNGDAAYAFAEILGGETPAYNSTTFGDVPLSGGAYTIALWYFVPDDIAASASSTGNVYRMVSKRTACTDGNFFDIQYSNSVANGSRCGVEIRATGLTNTASVGADCPAGAWTHLAVVIDSANRTTTTYTNGAVSDQNTSWADNSDEVALAGPLGLSASPCIGAQSTTRGFVGSLDDLVVYDRALSASEVATLAGY